ncbi:MAG: carboxypeptidase regulatory-like domain-containing protein [Terriglobales bacterium]
MSQSFSFKRVGSFVVALAAALAVTCLIPAAARAQNSSSGTIIGQITDQQKAAVPSAVITLTSAATGGTQATISNGAGRYTFPNLQGGTYTLDVKKQGFKDAAVRNQLVVVGKTLTLNVPMQVGEATQTVEVTATGAELQTMNATVGDTVSGQAILLAPNLSRDANSLTNLQPNTANDGGVAGADSDQNSYTLDGGNNSDDMDGNHADYTGTQGGSTSGTIPVPADSIEQFSIGVNNQTADVNSAAGSSVNMVTKRGTDALHGSAYDYYLGSYLSANSWSRDRTGTDKPKNHQNRFGLSLGGPILPNWLGGKTYVFGLFEGVRVPGQSEVDHWTPSDLLRAGVVQVDNGSGTPQAYNLNLTAVTVDGQTYQPAKCNLPGGGTGACDPRKLGLNPVINQLWTQYMPAANDTLVTDGDGYGNALVFKGQYLSTRKSNFAVARVDHDFGTKNHLSFTYHFFSENPISSAQIDIAGGHPVASTQRPQLPSMWTAELTSNLTSNVTNAFHYSYLRNFWQWSGANYSPTPLTGFKPLGGVLEVGGESHYDALIPYNINTQSVRSRYWDGIGHTFADDLTVLKGNNIFQFGGKYTHQRDMHQRNDNGGGVMADNVYQIGGNTASIANAYTPTDFTSKADTGAWEQYYNEVLGIVDQPQTLYTRVGPKLNLQPLGTPMQDNSLIPMYNVYFSDSWHVRPNLTLTYGTGYTVEMPPFEVDGKQVELVDAAGGLIAATDYLASTQRAALAGQNYNPELGFATVGNVGGGLKYPYRTFYGGFSPRLSLAWNPNFQGGLLGAMFGANKTVMRGGWARIYGRLNGVDLVLVPLLGTGLGQPVTCLGATMSGACTGNGGATPLNAFRIGTDGMSAPLGNAPTATLPQPFYPGETQNGVANASAAAGEVLDPDFKPNRSDEFDVTIQRQVSPNFSTEIGYTGRTIRNEYQGINLDAVPYMMTAGGQQFQQAFANLYSQIAAGNTVMNPQSFFEAAMGGANSAFCKGYANCTTAVAAKYGPGGKRYINPQKGNNVYTMWAAMNGDPSWTLGRTFASSPTAASGGGQLQAIFSNDSVGWGNYNSLFWSVNMRNWHGLTAMSNFTWSRSFGTGQVDQATSEYTVADPFNMHAMYGPQPNDIPLNYNLYFIYQPGSQTEHGLLGHLAHGWSFAPILTWDDGGWADVNNGGDCASFGEGDCNTESTYEEAVKVTGYTGGTSVASNVVNGGSAGYASNGSRGGTGMNRFGSNAEAIYSEFRPIILGQDTTSQSGLIPGLSRWNVDFAIVKDLAISERFGAQLSAQASNVFNHFSPSEYSLNISRADRFGAINGDAEGPRTVEVGMRLHW